MFFVPPGGPKSRRDGPDSWYSAISYFPCWEHRRLWVCVSRFRIEASQSPTCRRTSRVLEIATVANRASRLLTEFREDCRRYFPMPFLRSPGTDRRQFIVASAPPRGGPLRPPCGQTRSSRHRNSGAILPSIRSRGMANARGCKGASVGRKDISADRARTVFRVRNAHSRAGAGAPVQAVVNARRV